MDPPTSTLTEPVPPPPHTWCGRWGPATCAVGERAQARSGASGRAFGPGAAPSEGTGRCLSPRHPIPPSLWASGGLAHSWHLIPAHEIWLALVISATWRVGSRASPLCRGQHRSGPAVRSLDFPRGLPCQTPPPERSLLTGQGPDPLSACLSHSRLSITQRFPSFSSVRGRKRRRRVFELAKPKTNWQVLKDR